MESTTMRTQQFNSRESKRHHTGLKIYTHDRYFRTGIEAILSDNALTNAKRQLTILDARYGEHILDFCRGNTSDDICLIVNISSSRKFLITINDTVIGAWKSIGVALKWLDKVAASDMQLIKTWRRWGFYKALTPSISNMEFLVLTMTLLAHDVLYISTLLGLSTKATYSYRLSGTKKMGFRHINDYYSFVCKAKIDARQLHHALLNKIQRIYYHQSH